MLLHYDMRDELENVERQIKETNQLLCRLKDRKRVIEINRDTNYRSPLARKIVEAFEQRHGFVKVLEVIYDKDNEVTNIHTEQTNDWGSFPRLNELGYFIRAFRYEYVMENGKVASRFWLGKKSELEEY